MKHVSDHLSVLFNLHDCTFNCMIGFQELNFNLVKKILKMSHLYFNEEMDYSEENTYENEVFCSTIGRN